MALDVASLNRNLHHHRPRSVLLLMWMNSIDQLLRRRRGVEYWLLHGGAHIMGGADPGLVRLGDEWLPLVVFEGR